MRATGGKGNDHRKRAGSLAIFGCWKVPSRVRKPVAHLLSTALEIIVHNNPEMFHTSGRMRILWFVLLVQIHEGRLFPRKARGIVFSSALLENIDDIRPTRA